MPRRPPRGADRLKQMQWVGGRIRQARNELHMTQRDFADALGFSAFATISAQERGENGIDAIDLFTIARLTGYPVAWFLDPNFDEKAPQWPRTRIEWLTMAGGNRQRADAHAALDQVFSEAER